MASLFKNYRLFFSLIFVLCIVASCTTEHQTPKVITVEIKDMKFSPDTITVNKGDTVLWINRDMVAHDATEVPSKAWTSGPINPGGSWKMVVTGSADYYCSIHVVMKAKIQVK